VVALFGPTGVGKTAVAVALGKLLADRGEHPVAISADALQVYRGLEVLSGAASARERACLEHRLLGVIPVTETFSAGRFAELAHAEIDDALAAGRRPIVVGGTGLYLRAALADLTLKPPPPTGVRARLEREVDAHGPEELHRRLAAVRPAAAAAIAPTDRTRVIRALELIEMGDEPHTASDGSELWTRETRHPSLLVGLTLDRAVLYGRIEARVDAMVAAGVVAEVRRAEAAGASRTARSALGFTELLEGDLAGMKRRSRNLARRQLTWMRKLPGVRMVDLTGREPAEVAFEVGEWLLP
jgi:tRNA dimethylallyltransferase